MRCQSAAHEGAAGRWYCVFKLSIRPLLVNTVDHFYGGSIDLSKQEKHRLEFITLTMAAFHLGELGPELWYSACLLGTAMDTGTLNRTVPSLVAPLFVLLQQVKMSDGKRVHIIGVPCGNFFKFGTNGHLVSRMDLLDFGSQGSRSLSRHGAPFPWMWHLRNTLRNLTQL